MLLLMALPLFIGCFLVYITSPNQVWRPTHFPKTLRVFGYLAISLALAGLLIQLDLPSALFTWFALLMIGLPSAAFVGWLGGRHG